MSDKPTNRPTHIAYIVPEAKEGSDKKSNWHEVGVVWKHSKGNGFDLVIHERISVTGRIVCTERKDQSSE